MPSQTAGPQTKTDRKMEDAMLAAAGDSDRVHVLSVARTFKRSWIELGEALTQVHAVETWERWGFPSFDAYCVKELHLKKATVLKLLGSFRFLESNAPKVIRRTREEPAARVPSLAAVDFVRRAVDRGAADASTMKEIKIAVFDEGAEAPLLSRRYREVAFPVSEEQRVGRLKTQLQNTARRLANLIAEPDAPVPRETAVAVEEAVGRLLEQLADA